MSNHPGSPTRRCNADGITQPKTPMRRPFQAFSTALAATLLGALVAPAGAAPTVPLSGRVLAAGRGLADAEVTLMAANGHEGAAVLGSTRADGQGRFTLAMPGEANRQL